MSGRDITLQIFVEAHDIDKCAHAMQSLKNSMRWDEQVYGREYDLDLYMIVARLFKGVFPANPVTVIN
jgi:aminopeptidase N